MYFRIYFKFESEFHGEILLHVLIKYYVHSFTGHFPFSFYTQVSFEESNLDSLSMLLCFIYFTELITDQRIQPIVNCKSFS